MTAMARPALLYFLLWLGVTLSTAMDLQKRIINGHNCANTERLYHVKLITTSWRGNNYICGGSLIREQWVLTAAHCWKRFGRMTAYVNVNPGPPEIIPVRSHKIYKENIFRSHDIMLVKLSRSPRNIHTIDIPTEAECVNDIQVGDLFQVAGHGINAIDPTTHAFLVHFPAVLQCLDNVPVVACGMTGNKIPGHRPRLPLANAFCAHTTQPPLKDTAGGDSGGGVLLRNKIYGIVAGGHATHAFVIPFYFVRVCSYRPWIERTAVP